MKRVAMIVGVALLLMATANHVFAAQIGGRTIENGEVHNGDLELFGDSLTIAAGGEVHGNVTVLGGNANIAGTIDGDMSILGGDVHLSGNVEGDLFIMGGNLELREDADVDGDCVLLGGKVDDSANSSVVCTDIGQNIRLGILQGLPGPVSPPEVPGVGGEIGVRSRSTLWDVFSGIGQTVGQTLLLGALAWMIAALWPDHLVRVADTVKARPFASGAVGLLTTGAFISLMTIVAILSGILLIVCIGLLGFPILMLMALIFGVAALLGWVAVGYLVGSRIGQPLNLSKNVEVNIAVTGTVLITFILTLFASLPSFLGSSFLANLVIVVVGFAGLGAAALTRLGRERYPLATAGPGYTKSSSVMNTLPDDE